MSRYDTRNAKGVDTNDHPTLSDVMQLWQEAGFPVPSRGATSGPLAAVEWAVEQELITLDEYRFLSNPRNW